LIAASNNAGNSPPGLRPIFCARSLVPLLRFLRRTDAEKKPSSRNQSSLRAIPYAKLTFTERRLDADQVSECRCLARA